MGKGLFMSDVPQWSRTSPNSVRSRTPNAVDLARRGGLVLDRVLKQLPRCEVHEGVATAGNVNSHLLTTEERVSQGYLLIGHMESVPPMGRLYRGSL